MADLIQAASDEPRESATSDTWSAAPVPVDWEWAIVEIFGHRRHVGRTREEERFGAKMLRIDIPVKGDPGQHGWVTHYYGGSAIFSFSLTDEASALRANKPWEAPSRLLAAPDGEDDEDGFR